MTSLLTLEFVVKIVSIRWIALLREANVTSKENCLDCLRHRLWITRPQNFSFDLRHWIGRGAKFRAYFRTIWKEIRVRQASNSLHWLDSPENIPKHHKSPELVLLIFWRVFDFAENNTSSRNYNFDNNQKEQEQRLVLNPNCRVNYSFFQNSVLIKITACKLCTREMF